MTQKEKIFLFLIIFLVYLNSIVNPFIFDDIALVVNNGFIKNFKFLKYYFTSNLFKCAGEEDLFYRPFQTLFYAIVYKISKGNTFGYHLLNILLHSGCAVLIYLLLTKLYDKKTSFLVSLLWGIHPINTEAITYISGTADPLFLFFGLLGIYLYNLSYSSSKKKHLFLILSCISFIFSLLSKETSVLILPLFFLYLYSIGNLKKEKKSDYIIITSIFLIYLILRKTVLNFGKTEPEEIFLYRFFTSFKAFLVYISILIFPFILSMERHLPYIKTPKDIDFISGLFLFILFLYFLWKKRNDKKILFAGLLFLLNFIFHSNTIIPLNGNLREHWMYVGAIGFFIYFVMLIEKIKKEKIKIALIILIFSLYGVRTILRNYDWLDPISFYEKSL
ncbi:MAG TPA: glycosyltransferase family 39 protein, partial [bacterium]|nr:glycosyltransferase family 39 protein [bacterium]